MALSIVAMTKFDWKLAHRSRFLHIKVITTLVQIHEVLKIFIRHISLCFLKRCTPHVYLRHMFKRKTLSLLSYLIRQHYFPLSLALRHYAQSGVPTRPRFWTPLRDRVHYKISLLIITRAIPIVNTCHLLCSKTIQQAKQKKSIQISQKDKLLSRLHR